MGNKLLSFLGPTRYLEAYYLYEDGKTDTPSQFIQEALAKLFCRNWNSQDSIIIFLTAESKKKNWYSKKRVPDANFEMGLEEGLQKIVREHLELAVNVEHVEIPEGRNESELWEIFERINCKINENDSILFDVTHSYRSLPLVALIVLNFVKFLKKVKINKVTYGAMEALGSLTEVKNLPIEKRMIPIFDLTPFVTLFDWTIATERFLETGNAQMISELGIEKLTPLFKTRSGRGRSLRNLIQALESFSTNMATCRAPDLKHTIERILNSIPPAEKELDELRPFRPLVRKIKERFSVMEIEHDVSCGLESADWCLEHDLIQQGFTILRETIINHVIMRNLESENFRKKENREIAEKLLYNRCERIPKKLFNLWHELIEYRNDLNHAGWGGQNYHSPNNFERKLEEFLKRFKILLTSD